MTTYLFLAIIALLVWGIRLLRIDYKKLEEEILELEKSNKELIEVNYKLYQKLNKKSKY